MTSLSELYSSHKMLVASIAVAFFVLSWVLLVFISPVVIGSLPEDYFVNADYLKTESVFDPDLKLARRCALLLKNTLAWFLILIGPILFQSIFAPFFGLLLAEFKGKPRMIRAFASNRLVWRALNAVRRKRRLPQFAGPPASR